MLEYEGPVLPTAAQMSSPRTLVSLGPNTAQHQAGFSGNGTFACSELVTPALSPRGHGDASGALTTVSLVRAPPRELVRFLRTKTYTRVNARCPESGCRAFCVYRVIPQGFTSIPPTALPSRFDGDRPGPERNLGGSFRTPTISAQNSRSLGLTHAEKLTGRFLSHPERNPPGRGSQDSSARALLAASPTNRLCRTRWSTLYWWNRRCILWVIAACSQSGMVWPQWLRSGRRQQSSLATSSHQLLAEPANQPVSDAGMGTITSRGPCDDPPPALQIRLETVAFLCGLPTLFNSLLNVRPSQSI